MYLCVVFHFPPFNGGAVEGIGPSSRMTHHHVTEFYQFGPVHYKSYMCVSVVCSTGALYSAIVSL